MFSWAAASGIYGYRRAKLAAGHLKDLIKLIESEAGIGTIHIVAHSMGNAVVMDALDSIASERLPLRVGELVMAAPDVSRDLFKQLALRISAVTQGMTLYASSKDKALQASKALALNIPRAGDVPADGPLVLPGMDTIDVSEFGEEFLGLNHGTFAENRSVIDDIGRLLASRQHPPSVRTPQLRGMPDWKTPPDHWKFPP